MLFYDLIATLVTLPGFLIQGKTQAGLAWIRWQYGCPHFETLKALARDLEGRWVEKDGQKWWRLPNLEAFFDSLPPALRRWPRFDVQAGVAGETLAMARCGDHWVVRPDSAAAAWWLRGFGERLAQPGVMWAPRTADWPKRLVLVLSLAKRAQLVREATQAGLRVIDESAALAPAIEVTPEVGFASLDLKSLAHYAVLALELPHEFNARAFGVHRSVWPEYCECMERWGLSWTGEGPLGLLPRRDPLAMDLGAIPGWDVPNASGMRLRSYQRDAVTFFGERGGRIILADDPGSGKTAVAIACHRGMRGKKALVICPATARGVWEEEIRLWAGNGESPSVQQLRTSGDVPFAASEWVIVSYDMLALRSQTLQVTTISQRDSVDRAARAAGVTLDWYEVKGDRSARWIAETEAPFDLPTCCTAEFRDVERRLSRLRRQCGFLDALCAYCPDTIVLDEAHRVKNAAARRSESVRRLVAGGPTSIIELTGTPVRNTIDEPATLLSYLEPSLAERFGRGGVGDEEANPT